MKLKNFLRSLNKTVCILFFLVIFTCFCAPSSAYPHVPVVESDTIDYYTSYGDPDIHGSLRGDWEFTKGENVTLQIIISNKGTIEKIVSNESTGNIRQNLKKYSVEVSEGKYEDVFNAEKLWPFIADMNAKTHLSEKARKEMAYEASRPNALSVKAQLVSPSTRIKIPKGQDVVCLDELKSGYFNMITFPIEIAQDIESGEYIFDLIVDYDFLDNVKMYKTTERSNISSSFLKEKDSVQELKSESRVISVPVYIKATPLFEISDVSGSLYKGQNMINVTYKNIGDAPAYDAESKISPMNPLSSQTTKIFIGDLYPGESKTVTYVISATDKAIEKEYVINTDIRYFDDRGDLYISPTMKLSMDFIIRKSILSFKNVVYTLFAILVLYGIFTFVRNMKQSKE